MLMDGGILLLFWRGLEFFWNTAGHAVIFKTVGGPLEKSDCTANCKSRHKAYSGGT